jgi:hypothetical protein
VPSVRIIYGVDGGADHDDAAVLQRYAPGDFDVSIAPLPDPDGAAVEAALGTDPVDLALLLCELNAPAIVEALRRRRWNSKLIVRWSFDFPKQLGLLYALRSAADAWIFSDAEAGAAAVDCRAPTWSRAASTATPSSLSSAAVSSGAGMPARVAAPISRGT